MSNRKYTGQFDFPEEPSNEGSAPILEGVQSVKEFEEVIPNKNESVDLWDWAPAIQAAIDQCVTSKKDTVELRDNKTYIIKSPIVVKKGITLRLGANTKLDVIGNFRVIEVEVDACLTGGIIETSDTTFDNDFIYLDGKNVFYTYNKTKISDILLRNKSGSLKGRGLSLFAGTRDWQCISFVNFMNLRIMGFNHAVYLDAPTPANTNVWINANKFINFAIEDCVNGIELNSNDTTPNECSGNFFLEFQIQMTVNSLTAITVDGSYNVFRGFVWDTHRMSHTNPIVKLTNEANYNYVHTNLPTWEWLRDEGSYNYFSSPREDALYEKSLTPSDPSKWYMAGDQDDVLVNADKFATVLQTAGPTKSGSSYPQLFDLLKETWMGWDNTTEANPTVLEIDLGTSPISYFKSIGMVFAGLESPKYIKFEFATSSGGAYNQSEVFSPNNKSVVQSYRIRLTNVYKIKITMWGSNNTTSNRIKATRIFATAGQTQGKAWISTSGGKAYGDIELGRSTDGIIMTASDGSRWKLSINSTGVTSWTKL